MKTNTHNTEANGGLKAPGLRFLKKGIKDSEGKYYPCWYSYGVLIGDTEPSITIYARKHCGSLPAELSPINDTDMQTDYFEEDRARIRKGTPWYDELMRKGYGRFDG